MGPDSRITAAVVSHLRCACPAVLPYQSGLCVFSCNQPNTSDGCRSRVAGRVDYSPTQSGR